MNNKPFYFRSIDRIAKQYDELVKAGELYTWIRHVSMLYGVPTLDVLVDVRVFTLKWLGE